MLGVRLPGEGAAERVGTAGRLAVPVPQPARHILPPERYPRLSDAAAAAATSYPVTEFRAGLDILIAGLAAVA